MQIIKAGEPGIVSKERNDYKYAGMCNALDNDNLSSSLLQHCDSLKEAIVHVGEANYCTTASRGHVAPSAGITSPGR